MEKVWRTHCSSQRSSTSPRFRKPRQARINANQPGLVNDLGGEGGAATRASAETTAPEDYDYEVLASPQERLQELQEQLQELQEQRQEASAFPTIDPSTDVAEPGGGFIQPGVYRSIMRNFLPSYISSVKIPRLLEI